MSVGLFMGIRASYIPEAQHLASAYLEAINNALRDAGLDEYREPLSPPSVYQEGLFGRSALDHHSAPNLVRLAHLAGRLGNATHARLLEVNPYRVAFVPIAFAKPLPTSYSERIAEDWAGIWVGSAPAFWRELVSLAPALGIPLEGTELSRPVAERINACEPLQEGDATAGVEDDRTSWLLVFEGARLAVEHGIALSFAG